jgi:hypothetical protein
MLGGACQERGPSKVASSGMAVQMCVRSRYMALGVNVGAGVGSGRRLRFLIKVFWGIKSGSYGV